MPHFILEYSANLEQAGVQVGDILRDLAESAVGTGIFPRAGVRARAHRCEDYYIADGRKEFAFVHLDVRIGKGRTDEEKRQSMDAFVGVLRDSLKSISDSRGLAISFELNELPEGFKTNINNLRDHL